MRSRRIGTTSINRANANAASKSQKRHFTSRQSCGGYRVKKLGGSPSSRPRRRPAVASPLPRYPAALPLPRRCRLRRPDSTSMPGTPIEKLGYSKTQTPPLSLPSRRIVSAADFSQFAIHVRETPHAAAICACVTLGFSLMSSRIFANPSAREPIWTRLLDTVDRPLAISSSFSGESIGTDGIVNRSSESPRSS